MRCFRLFVLATAAAGGVLLAPARADAHAIHAKVEVSAQAVKLEAYFDDDIPAEFAEAVVTDASGAVVVSGKTDERGVWTFAPPKPGAYVLTVKSIGHTTTVKFEVAGEPEAPVEYIGPRANKLLGLAVGLVVIVALTTIFWFLRRGRRIR
jgi:hypothetical protein